MRVLFVGNSYVYVNDLPGLVATLAEAGGAEILARSVAEGGMTLLGPSRSGDAVARIREGGWDAVILQEQSTRPISAPAAMRVAASLLASEVERAGSRTLLYLTWARQGQASQQAILDDTYRRVGGELGAAVVPVGPAWRRAQSERLDLPLYQADGSHPAPAGTYLAACVFFATLTGRSPVGLDARTVRAGDGGESIAFDLPVEDAELLQRIAWETVFTATALERSIDDTSRAMPQADLEVSLDVALAMETPLLRGLKSHEAQTLLMSLNRTTVPSGTMLYSSGSLGATAFLALDGAFDIATPTGETARYDLTWLGLAACLGDESLRGAPYATTVTTASEATVLEVRDSDLLALAAREPSLVATIQHNLRPA